MLVIILVSFAIFSCGEKISRPSESSFNGAAVLVDQATLWGFNSGNQAYEQVLPNGGMESWAQIDTTEYELNSWLLSSDSIFAFRETLLVAEGDYSAELYWISENDQTFKSASIPVVAESVYTCSLYVYDNDEAGQVQLVYYWNNGTTTGFDKTGNAADWQVLTGEAAAPAGADSVQIGLRFEDLLEGLSDTAFIQLNPPWDSANGYSFNNPGKIIVGRDTYLYVCDTDSNRIVRMDAAGTVYNYYQVDHPIGITQNELLHLLVVNGTGQIYKIDVGPNGDGVAVVSFSTDSPSADSVLGDNFIFTDISDMPSYDKSYLACGYDNLIDGTGQVYIIMGSSEVAPNTDILVAAKFPVAGADPNAPDTARNPMVDYGTGVSYTDHPNGITAFMRSSGLYLLTTQDSSSFKTQLLSWYTNSYYHVAYFEAALMPGSAELYAGNYRNIRPNAATIDSSGNIYIVCAPDVAAGDSACAYKFDPNGVFKEAWGFYGAGLGELNNPRGIAYDNFADRRTVYISDSGNNRILRFKLSIDIEN